MRILNAAAIDDRYFGAYRGITSRSERTCVLDSLGVRIDRPRSIVDSAASTFHLSRAARNAYTLCAVVCKIK